MNIFLITELQVTEPQFGPSIGGLSAFAAYPLPWAEESTPQGLEITLILVPANDEQVILLTCFSMKKICFNNVMNDEIEEIYLLSFNV